MTEYKKTCEDELDWTLVNQLHEATLQISNSCFEFKKICVGLIGATLAILVKVTDGEIDSSYFLIPLLICFGFWIADASAYYFQRRTRSAMNLKLKSIALRNNLPDYDSPEVSVSLIGAVFNSSMSLYYVFILIGGASLLYMHCHGV